MMKELKLTSQFKRDLKRIKNNVSKREALKHILEILRTGGSIPPHYLPHKLTGNYRGCMECHIESDFLLIWIDEESKTVTLVRLGSHSELFRK